MPMYTRSQMAQNDRRESVRPRSLTGTEVEMRATKSRSAPLGQPLAVNNTIFSRVQLRRMLEDTPRQIERLRSQKQNRSQRNISTRQWISILVVFIGLLAGTAKAMIAGDHQHGGKSPMDLNKAQRTLVAGAGQVWEIAYNSGVKSMYIDAENYLVQAGDHVPEMEKTLPQPLNPQSMAMGYHVPDRTLESEQNTYYNHPVFQGEAEVLIDYLQESTRYLELLEKLQNQDNPEFTFIVNYYDIGSTKLGIQRIAHSRDHPGVFVQLKQKDAKYEEYHDEKSQKQNDGKKHPVTEQLLNPLLTTAKMVQMVRNADKKGMMLTTDETSRSLNVAVVTGDNRTLYKCGGDKRKRVIAKLIAFRNALGLNDKNFIIFVPEGSEEGRLELESAQAIADSGVSPEFQEFARNHPVHVVLSFGGGSSQASWKINGNTSCVSYENCTNNAVKEYTNDPKNITPFRDSRTDDFNNNLKAERPNMIAMHEAFRKLPADSAILMISGFINKFVYSPFKNSTSMKWFTSIIDTKQTTVGEYKDYLQMFSDELVEYNTEIERGMTQIEVLKREIAILTRADDVTSRRRRLPDNAAALKQKKDDLKALKTKCIGRKGPNMDYNTPRVIMWELELLKEVSAEQPLWLQREYKSKIEIPGQKKGNTYLIKAGVVSGLYKEFADVLKPHCVFDGKMREQQSTLTDVVQGGLLGLVTLGYSTLSTFKKNSKEYAAKKHNVVIRGKGEDLTCLLTNDHDNISNSDNLKQIKSGNSHWYNISNNNRIELVFGSLTNRYLYLDSLNQGDAADLVRFAEREDVAIEIDDAAKDALKSYAGISYTTGVASPQIEQHYQNTQIANRRLAQRPIDRLMDAIERSN